MVTRLRVILKTKTGEWEPPAFGEGLDQSLALLMNGVDYSYLVHPEPRRFEDQEALRKLCERYAPHLGVLIAGNKNENI